MIINQPRNRRRGQALAEFALTLPVLLFFVLGIIEFGRILFTYAQASNSLRTAVRQAEILGYDPTAAKSYLNCSGMQTLAGDVYFAHKPVTVDIKYIKHNDTSITYTCSTVSDSVLQNGDILQIDMQAIVSPMFFPIGDLTMHFRGERTIVKAISIGATCSVDEPDCDSDYDGLVDSWEETHFGSKGKYNATDDPDADGCNNGCEETRGTDPLVPDGDTSTDGGSTGGSTGGSDGSTGGGSSGGTDGGIAIPPAPANFTASSNCSTGEVTFNWDWGGSIPTRAEIRDADSGLVIVRMDAQEPGVMPNNYCVNCDRINTQNGLRRYYMFSVNGTSPGEVQGPDSAISGVSCVAPPPAPFAFNATPDCTTGKVDFGWQWGSTTTLPTRAEIRDLYTNQVVVNITDTSQTFIDNGDTISTTAGNRSYYIVAYNGNSVDEKVSAASNAADAVCNSSTYAGKITGTLWLDNNKNSKNDDNTGWGTATTTIVSSTCNIDNFDDNNTVGWSGTNIGDANQGSFIEAGGYQQVSGDGTSYWAEDNTYFAYQPVTGDFRIELDIVDFAPITSGTWQKGGLTIRNGLTEDDKRVMINYVPAFGLLQFGYRADLGATSGRFASDVAVTLPVRVAIEKVGNLYTGYYSTDHGLNWTKPGGELGGSVTVELNTLLVGSAVSSYFESSTMTGKFDNFSLCRQITSIENGVVNLRGPGGVNYRTTINSAQAYSFPELPPGTYTITIPEEVEQGNKVWLPAKTTGDIKVNLSSNTLTLTISANQEVTVNFAYYK